MGIRRRLLLSFLALFVAVFAVTAVLTTALIARAVEDRLESLTRNMARFFAAQPGMVNPVVLDRVRLATEAQSAAVEPVGRIPPGPGVFRAPVDPGHELVLVFAPELISTEKSRAVRPFAMLAVGGGVLVALLGVFTARAIARPLEELSAQARSLPAGDVRPVGGGAELDHLVEAMNRMLAQVRQRERLAVMGQMAAGVAHEIRNPLSSIKMTVQMLRGGAGDAEPYDVILREIERLELTAAELVGVSQPLRREPAKLESVVDEVVELMKRRLQHLGVRLERRYAPVSRVQVDVARFKRCVMNLILNGAQAMPSGGPLSLEIGPRDGRVRLAVTDAGEGIPAEVRDRVFEPFVTSKQDGVGLGLALTRRIVEDHGGSIGFDSRDRGTTFWIELPHG
jgi:signal transduction histidine kinase